jgi:nitrate reductase gamma subunit
MMPRALFVLWPYAAAAVFAIALAARSLRASGPIPALRARAAEGWAELRASRAWRAGIGGLLAGHLAGVLLPEWILRWTASPARLYGLEAAAFALGAIAAAGWAPLATRALLRRTGSRAANLADALFLSLVGVALASGLAAAVDHRWATSWAVRIVGPYARSLVEGAPRPALLAQLPFLVQLHVVASFAALALVPLTRLGPALVLAVRAPIHAAGGALSAARHALAGRLRRLDLAARLWPDED